MNYEESNKLIAEFMGWSFSKSGRTARIGKGKKSIPYRLSDIHYHTSWDWLMPVWSKVWVEVGLWAQTSANLQHSRLWVEKSDIIKSAILIGDISKCTLEIYRLIQWYNQQKDNS